jgi:hypothetical protein
MGNGMRWTAVRVFLATLGSGWLPASAHHGTIVTYDMTKLVTLTGSVKEWRFANPHAQLYFVVIGDKGEAVQWGGELNSPALLRRDGWTKDLFQPGDEITLSVHPSKAGTPFGVVDRSKPVIVNGKELPRSHGNATE